MDTDDDADPDVKSSWYDAALAEHLAAAETRVRAAFGGPVSYGAALGHLNLDAASFGISRLVADAQSGEPDWLPKAAFARLGQLHRADAAPSPVG